MEEEIKRKYKIAVVELPLHMVNPMAGKTHLAFCLTPMPLMQVGGGMGYVWSVGFLPPVEGRSLEDALRNMRSVIEAHVKGQRRHFEHETHHYDMEV